MSNSDTRPTTSEPNQPQPERMASLEAAEAPMKAELASKVVEVPQHDAVQAAGAQVAAAGTPPLAPPPLTNDLSAVAATSHPDAPVEADDADLIEPEWVDKAKKIVERTHDDPYMQNKEISRFKADYLKKRYKKEIKVSEA